MLVLLRWFMKCVVCVSYLAEVKVVLEEADVTSESAPKVTENQQQSVSTEGGETSQKIKKKKKRKLDGTEDSTSSECLILL